MRGLVAVALTYRKARYQSGACLYRPLLVAAIAGTPGYGRHTTRSPSPRTAKSKSGFS